MIAREVLDADDPRVGAVAGDGLGHQHRVGVALGKGQHPPAVVDAADETPFHGGVRGGGKTAQRRGVTAVAADLLGEELITQGEHVQGLVDVVDFVVLGLLFLDLEPLAQRRHPAAVGA